MSKVKSIVSNKMVQGTGIFTFGMLLMSIINYVLQMVLGRYLLSIEDFGLFNSLLSLTLILTVPGNSIMFALIKQVNKLKTKNDFSTLTELYWGVSVYALLIGAIASFFVLVLNKQIASYFNLPTTMVLVPFAFYLCFTFLNIVPRAYLQGLLRFKGFAFYTTMQATMRLAFPVMLLLLGFGVGSVFSGMTISLFMAFLLAMQLLKKNFISYEPSLSHVFYLNLLRLSIPVILIQVSVNILMGVDMLFVKHFFDPLTAGLYASVVTIGKVLLFGTGIISSVMYPIITDAYNKNDKFLKKFSIFLGIQALAVLGGLVVFGLFPKLITAIMFGSKYLPAVELLPKYTLFIGIFALLNFLVFFSLAVDKHNIVYALLVGIIFQIVLINLYHPTLSAIININTAIVVILLIVLIFYLLLSFKSDVRKSINNSTGL